MRKFILITLAIIILYLLWKNREVMGNILKTVTGIFDQSFKSVTEVGDFK